MPNQTLTIRFELRYNEYSWEERSSATVRTTDSVQSSRTLKPVKGKLSRSVIAHMGIEMRRPIKGNLNEVQDITSH